ncbi:phosphoribosylglycinamide formyltransferase [Methanorbis rubei]|uniref:phosphoribosylglycinamide formyltransferase 1 n=1 Tax=Methanorbis rubei TaxID=3028300 RepID=A0AAE4MGQ0_9EURY|nr:Phosphoribosylglycinamide formyltransferase [Methanocorpusculaceae archaeon Cs1]
MKRIAVLASGRGSNFQAILDALSHGEINGECIALFTDNKDAYAIERAKAAGVPAHVINFKDYSSKAAYETDLLSAMKSANADLFVCAGYMRIIGAEIIREFAGKMINIHPALLPAFSGLHGQRQALEYGVKIAGCTVHFVDEGLDSGPIILQKAVPVLDDDDEEALDDRILTQEHIAFPEAIALFCDDRLVVSGRHVKILEKK